MNPLTQEIPPEAIQDTLSKIWESLETTSTTRASLFNLIFYTKKTSRTAYVQKLAQKVVEKFPSRILFICDDDTSKESRLKARVSIFSATHGEYDVACDYIQLDASGEARHHLPFVVLPHILPDLPIYLAWAEDPSHPDSLLPKLEGLATRLIFDSETTENLSLFAQALFTHYKKTQVDIADLNWARIENWRDLLSMVFYSPESLENVKKAERITICYNAQESQFFCHTHIQAIYLQAWIACQLNWEFKTLRREKQNLLFSYERQQRPVAISLEPLFNPQLPPGLICSLKISAEKERTYFFERNVNEIHRITLSYADEEKCALPAHYLFQKVESGHSLVKEITHRGTSQHFLKVIELLATKVNTALC